MRSLEAIIALNASVSGISVEENLRIAKSNQYLRKIGSRYVSVPPAEAKSAADRDVQSKPPWSPREPAAIGR